ncbi:MAG: hypothetical protein HFJ22_07700 [Clostridia bacterium]|jgi:hypothetical protein|nr:hypothetical protein [Clostridia bacterium]MCI9517660.1 hypothetical protein [Clostridia bacterium]
MEQKQLKQFTFYDFYAELMDVLTDDERGKLLRRMCEYMFVSGEQTELSDKKLIFLWGNIEDYLNADKEAKISGKSVRASRQMKRFTFYRNFYEAVELMEDKQAGQSIKAVYNYVLNNAEPSKLVSPLDLYYTLAKSKLALSKVRSSIGKKGGNTERIPVTVEQVNAIQPRGLSSIGIKGFLKNNPQVKNDIYKSSMHLTEGIDWTVLDEELPVSKYCDCKSLYQILTHYTEIVGHNW